MKRLIDANINRICEGLRVIEDYLRFESFNNNLLDTIKTLKEIRHYLRKNISSNIFLINSRNVKTDPGTAYQKIESSRKTISDLIKANIYRVEEGLRVLEESFKMDDILNQHVKKIKSFRFTIYEIESMILSIISKEIDLNLICSIDISNIKETEIKKAFKKIDSKITALEFFSDTMSNIDFYNFSLLLRKEHIRLPLIIKDRLDIAICLKSEAFSITKNNLPLDIIRKNYSGSIITHLENLNDLTENNSDIYLIDNKPDKIKKAINNNITAFKINSINTDKLIISYYSNK